MTGFMILVVVASVGAGSGMTFLDHKRRKLNRLTMQALHQAELRAEDAALAHWCRRTMLTVTNRQGFLYAATLEMFSADYGGTDRTWADPIAVTLWTGTPDQISEVREQAKDFDA